MLYFFRVCFLLSFFSLQNFWADTILDNTAYFKIIAIYSFIILFQPLEDISQDLIMVQKKAGLYFIHQIIMIITSSSIILYMLYNDFGVMSVIWGNLYLSLFPFVFFLPVIIRNIKFKFDFEALKPLLKYGYPMIPASISVVLLQMLDHYILKYFYDVSTVGLYTFGYKFGGLIGFLIILPVQNILHPMMLELENNESELQKFFSKTLNYIFIISLIACLILSVFAKEVIILMAQNKDFYPTYQFIPIIAFAYVLYGLSEMTGKGILLSKKTIYMTYSVVSAAILNIILNLILIPYFSVFGAAFATLLSFLYLSIINNHFSRKLYHLKGEFRQLVFFSIIFAVFVLVALQIDTGELMLDILIKLLIIISYIFIIFVSMKKIDRRKIISILIK
jgi:O-antigen/teichoic acid export membrane protein